MHEKNLTFFLSMCFFYPKYMFQSEKLTKTKEKDGTLGDMFSVSSTTIVSSSRCLTCWSTRTGRTGHPHAVLVAAANGFCPSVISAAVFWSGFSLFTTFSYVSYTYKNENIVMQTLIMGWSSTSILSMLLVYNLLITWLTPLKVHTSIITPEKRALSCHPVKNHLLFSTRFYISYLVMTS